MLEQFVVGLLQLFHIVVVLLRNIRNICAIVGFIVILKYSWPLLHVVNNIIEKIDFSEFPLLAEEVLEWGDYLLELWEKASL